MNETESRTIRASSGSVRSRDTLVAGGDVFAGDRSVPSPYGFAGCGSVRSLDTRVAGGTCLPGTTNPNGTLAPGKFHLFLTCLSGGTGEETVPHNPNRLPTELLLPVPAKRTLIDDWQIDDW